MGYSRLRIDANYLAEQLAEALNDVGFGASEEAPWFVDEFFGRIKRNFHGSSVTLEEAVKTAQDLLDYQKPQRTSISETCPECGKKEEEFIFEDGGIFCPCGFKMGLQEAED